MSEVRPDYGDEIDLFELFETLWDGKWLISGFIVLVTLVGFGYSQLAQPQYEVSVPYTLNIYSVSAQQICGGNVNCIENEVNKELLALLDSGWNKANKGNVLSLTTESPSDVQQYISDIERHNQMLSTEIFNEAIAELALIQTELNDALLSTERVATNMLNAKRVIRMIDNGQNVVSFGSVSVAKTSPKVPLILVMSALVGGMIGVFFILVRYAVRNRKQKLT